MLKRLSPILGALLLVTCVSAGQIFPTMELSTGIHRIEAEVASTQSQRMQGLMYRNSMSIYHGMLFVFPEAARHCMWMRNTLLPLSVAFMDGNGKIINIEDMQPQTEDNHCAASPARYALEMNLEWFKRRGIVPGMNISGLERAPAAQ